MQANPNFLPLLERKPSDQVTESPILTCPCLNVRLQLPVSLSSSSSTLEELLKRLTPVKVPEVKGLALRLPLSIGGVTYEIKEFTRVGADRWIQCRLCRTRVTLPCSGGEGSGSKETSKTVLILPSSPYLYGEGVRKARESSSYSPTFHVLLPSLPPSSFLSKEENEWSEEEREFARILRSKQAVRLERLRAAAEARVVAFKEEQDRMLRQAEERSQGDVQGLIHAQRTALSLDHPSSSTASSSSSSSPTTTTVTSSSPERSKHRPSQIRVVEPQGPFLHRTSDRQRRSQRQMPASPAPAKLGFGTSLDPGLLSSPSPSPSSPSSPSSISTSTSILSSIPASPSHMNPTGPRGGSRGLSDMVRGNEQRVPHHQAFQEESEEELFLLDEETEDQISSSPSSSIPHQAPSMDRMDTTTDPERVPNSGSQSTTTPRRSPPPPLPTSSPFKVGRWRTPSRQKYQLTDDEEEEEREDEDEEEEEMDLSPNLYGSSLPIEIRRPSSSSLTSSSIARKSSLTLAMAQRASSKQTTSSHFTSPSHPTLPPPPASPSPSSPSPPDHHLLSRTLITGDPLDETMYSSSPRGRDTPIRSSTRTRDPSQSPGFIAPHEFSAQSYVGEREGLWGAVPMSSSRVDLVGRRSSLRRASKSGPSQEN
ncbi:MAG: hypothetical protein DHS80DRAFT_24783 [Piptocephalis tieghemiana]|nr:MAG: hypothetical protein DHS80DRAFT_24783 [Piptocephalis tieghemiana]